MNGFIDATQESGAAFVTRGIEGPVVMLNLLRFRDTADYAEHPELAPKAQISGRDAYEKYIAHTRPFLEAAGGKLLFMGKAEHFLIGPMEECWDLVLVVEHASVEAFLGFARNKAYLAGAGHRNAALLDSRLLPMWEFERG